MKTKFHRSAIPESNKTSIVQLEAVTHKDAFLIAAVRRGILGTTWFGGRFADLLVLCPPMGALVFPAAVVSALAA